MTWSNSVFKKGLKKTISIAIIHFICFISLFPSSTCSGSDSKINLSTEEQAWINKNYIVRVRIGSAPPFMLTDGETRGIAIDYLTTVFNRNGIKFKYVQESEVTWPQALKYIEQHDVVDMVPTAKVTDERKKHMLFTNEYIAAPWVIFTRSNADFVGSINDLKGKTVSVEEGFVIHDLLKRNYPDIKLKVASAKLDNNFAEIPIKDLSTGLVDAYIGNLMMTTYMIQTNGYTNVKVAAPTPFENHNQAMAIRNDWPELVSIINKTLSAMLPDEHASIRNRWLTIKYEYGINKVYVAKWVLGISVLAALIVGFVLFSNRRLKAEVDYRKRIEDDLSEGRSKLNAALDSMTDAVFISDQDGEFVEFNEAFATFHRLENKNACPKVLNDWPDILDVYSLDGKLVPLEMWAVSRALRGETVVNAEYQLKRKDTGETWFGSYNFAPIRDKDGKIYGAVVVGRDITENRELQIKLQQAQKMESIGNLAGGIAHEFNNILSIIIGNNELLMEELPEWSLARESTQEIRIAGMRARDAVKQLLTFSRQDNAVKKEMDFRLVVEESMKLIRSSTPINIKIQQILPDDVYPVLGNETQINQMLINLCSNAVDAMPTKGAVLTIELLNETVDETYAKSLLNLKPGQYVKLQVSDNGIGMDKETLDRIFEPYYTTKDIGKGSGIGLAVVHGIVERHGGLILADSHPGKGTIFTLFFPAYKGSLEVENHETEALPTGNETILYVDDEPSIATLGKRHLESLGYTTESITDPLEALELVRTDKNKFNLVISDMAMPNMTGDQLITEILKIRPDMPTIICTGYSAKISEEEAAEIGISSFAMKPLDKVDLAKKVRQVLDEKRS